MLNRRSWLLLMMLIFVGEFAYAHRDTTKNSSNLHNNENRVRFREDCDNAVSQLDMAINNVRARLLSAGDTWWDGSDGRYIVPKVPPGVPEVTSIFAGAVWLGGVDPAGNLKVAAQLAGRANGNFDFWPGPLDDVTGKTEQATCAQWDRFFRVTGEEIDEHLRNYNRAVLSGIDYDPALIPRNIKGWPATGNKFFVDIHQFELPVTSQGLALFFDQNGNDLYEPELGDYPIIDIRGCDAPQYPDEMTFWIYNDGGNIHAESMGDPIQMEVQVQAFAYQTNDEINDMTFQRYKLINRAVESIDSTFFAMWVDPDVGCFSDDYVGCDTTRSLAYVYNEDALDGETGCTCPQGINTYCDQIPILGVDYFRGPLDEFGQEIGMSSFTYFNNAGVSPTPPTGTTDPNNALEYYNYLSGSWQDGSPFTFGGDAYQDGSPINFAFTDAPNDLNGWSMCTAGLPPGDRRTVQASGPFRLDPGAVNELIVGVVWVPDQNYPCPSISKLQEADDIAQALFDNCFEITDGPDAPDCDFIELDQEIIVIFSNDEITSNNAFEAYAQRGLQIPPLEEDSLYVFEGYKLFQLSGPDVTIADLDDPDKARLVYQVDIKNGINRIFNWSTIENPTDFEVYVPELEVEGTDDGIRHTFNITEDQFADGDRRLVNHRKYYFTAIAYAHNEYLAFDPKEILGQRRPYLEGRRNIGDGDNPFYTVIPHPTVYKTLNAAFGDGAIVTRIDGRGAGGNSLDISPETRAAIEDGSFNGEITYRPGAAPIEINIFNPLNVTDGEFELTFIDNNLADDQLEGNVRWELRNLSDPGAPAIISERSIDNLNEQIIREFGFSIAIGQTDDVGDRFDDSNGAISYQEEFLSENPGEAWLTGIPDGFSPGLTALDEVIFDYAITNPGQEDDALDPAQALTTIGPGYFIPYMLANWRDREEPGAVYITPSWTDKSGSSIARGQMNLQDLNNVDIVFTSNKDLWTQCPVVESANRFYELQGFFAEGERAHFDLRSDLSVTKEVDANGNPQTDTNNKFSSEGMGWFPGYAIDVETGERLAIFFGENSVYNGTLFPEAYAENPRGSDMMFNPSSQLFLGTGGFPNIFQYMAGGQHFVYVTKLPYNDASLQTLVDKLKPGPLPLIKLPAIREITWAGLVLPLGGQSMLSYADGLIPEDMVVKLRVDNPYQVSTGTGAFDGYPTYRFKIEGKQAAELEAPEVETALDQIRVVPNPYYGFSRDETSQFTNIVKLTNLPSKCTVTIFSLDGKFIRQYTRDETPGVPLGNNRPLLENQITPDLEWDLRNSKGIPIASGVYLIHVEADDLGERTIKWFGVNRKFDPSGL